MKTRRSDSALKNKEWSGVKGTFPYSALHNIHSIDSTQLPRTLLF